MKFDEVLPLIAMLDAAKDEEGYADIQGVGSVTATCGHHVFVVTENESFGEFARDMMTGHWRHWSVAKLTWVPCDPYPEGEYERSF